MVRRRKKDVLSHLGPRERGEVLGLLLKHHPELRDEVNAIKAESGDPTGWAPIHALHLLGEIGSAKATGALLDWFRKESDTDFITEVGNVVFGRLGPGACDPIFEYL